MKAILLLSGGIDSVVSAGLAREQGAVLLHALTFDYGQRACAREITAAHYFAERWHVPHQVIPLPWLAERTVSALVDPSTTLPQYAAADLHDPEKQAASAKAVWVPNRNGLFLHIAATIAEAMHATHIVTGFNAEEAVTFPDNSSAFVDAINASLAYSTLTHPRVISLTQAMTKLDIVTQAQRLGLALDHCWPCYEGGEEWCHTCESCIRTQTAMRQAHA